MCVVPYQFIASSHKCAEVPLKLLMYKIKDIFTHQMPSEAYKLQQTWQTHLVRLVTAVRQHQLCQRISHHEKEKWQNGHGLREQNTIQN